MARETNKLTEELISKDYEYLLGRDSAKQYSYEKVYKMAIDGFLSGTLSPSFRDGFLEELKRERMEQIKE